MVLSQADVKKMRELKVTKLTDMGTNGLILYLVLPFVNTDR